MEGINLTPPQEIKRRRTQYVVGASTKLSVLLLLIVACIAAYYFVKSTGFQTQIGNLESQKADLTSKRESMKEIEGYAQKLSGKYFLLQKYLENRIKYSSVMQELLARVPEGVVFDTIGFEGVGKRARITGTSKDVVSVSSFIGRLTKVGNASDTSAVTLNDKSAFADVRLDSLSVNEGKQVNYAVSFRINEEAFLK